MRFQFDPRKATANFQKHGVSFADALAIHQPDTVGEERFIAVGRGSAEPILVVVYTLRGDDIRLISARRATRQEVTTYETRI